ncbi:MAG: cyclic nucleotide-binding domain-containing protein [Candidatus Latescibacteria bacterium]|nr:cyclic nucleotide-binding domain-containing protein [Candidatus Latescibacterota bacterium]
MNEKQYMLVKVIQKIEVFKHFDGTDVQRLLKVCKFRNFQQGEHIYTRGEASDEMLILLKGQLRVVSPSGDDLAVIQPGNPIGEMGLFTGQPRSADIVANDKSTAIVLRDEELKGLLAGAIDMHIKVLYNVINILSQRVSDANGLTETQARLIRDLEKKLGGAGGADDEYDDDEYEEEELEPVVGQE